MNGNKELKKAFNLFASLLEKTENEEMVNNLIDELLAFIEKIDDPSLAANFQTYWLEIREKIKAKTDENHFIIQERMIKLNIERIMFPELSKAD
ncbi:MAG: hypothetical protein PHG95_03000 [Patescibacteria group bacterium]|nr:hypothetical protein [Patescibacteria group bacterium]